MPLKIPNVKRFFDGPYNANQSNNIDLNTKTCEDQKCKIKMVHGRNNAIIL